MKWFRPVISATSFHIWPAKNRIFHLIYMHEIAYKLILKEIHFKFVGMFPSDHGIWIMLHYIKRKWARMSSPGIRGSVLMDWKGWYVVRCAERVFWISVSAVIRNIDIEYLMVSDHSVVWVWCVLSNILLLYPLCAGRAPLPRRARGGSAAVRGAGGDEGGQDRAGWRQGPGSLRSTCAQEVSHSLS